MTLQRGDLVIVMVAGDKPRPAVSIQSDALIDVETSLVCLLTSTIRDAPLSRLTIMPSDLNGLTQINQIMIDKIFAVGPAKIGQTIGRLTQDEVAALNDGLAVVIGLADPPRA